MDKSLKKIRDWFYDRTGFDEFLAFLKKKEVPCHSYTIWYYMGGAILILFLFQCITGIMLLLYYKPTIETAHKSVIGIMNDVPLGWIIRSFHRWSAYFMIAFVFIHLFSTLILKAYRKPREVTWITGCLLFITTLAFGFTGYLLPWDELSLAATKVGTDIPRSIPIVGEWITKLLRGGDDVTGDTLTRFFALHVCVLPLFILAILGIHFILIQKHGMSIPISIQRKKNSLRKIPFYPNFFYRELIFWMLIFGIVITLSLLFPATLGKEADLMAPTPKGVKPEWYFLFFFQTLKLFPSRILFIPGDTFAILLILIFGIIFFLLPFIDRKPHGRSGKIITYLTYVFLIYVIIMTIWGYLS
ncbi:cytochrome bc complex cytochrome b subunit [SCandidatus Aminicenantes bacterium Aminicenantia_JdfR_composite]|jgi:cytochrome b6|nr:cytochrome bc complex cytochrome b subunit [SCandidatus Aminicenantes bacterium Aminicenantia_JdfR_composite]MCP2597758.1 cytochrome bc complex cytochrome b subunit [Candidatus Aminicenantes bacterium AC-335-L06]MCP2605912.1 cytochrome bc complex cytochrome b subunit [Candidatus Aminicenantes bacterium AC-335-O07]